MSNTPPSIDPADNDSLAGTIRLAITKILQGTHVSLPAQIISYDRTKNRAQVQPMISLVDTSGNIIARAQIASVPVYRYGGGGFSISVPLNTGDLGWLIACDRDISNFLAYYNNSYPNTFRIHDFSDSFFLPDFMNGLNVPDEDLNNLVIQNSDGSIKITLSSDEINLENGDSSITIASEQITLTSPSVVINSTLTVNGGLILEDGVEGDLDISGKAVIQGDVNSGGNITAAGSITPFTPLPP